MCVSWLGYHVIYLFDSDLYFTVLLMNSSFKKEDMTLSYHCCCKGQLFPHKDLSKLQLCKMQQLLCHVFLLIFES